MNAWQRKQKPVTEMTNEEKVAAMHRAMKKAFPEQQILTRTINLDNNTMIVSEGSKREKHPALQPGEYNAVCTAVTDIGTHTRDGYQGAPAQDKREVVLTWVIPGETVKIDGEDMPRMISKTYTASLDERANLRQHLESWRDKDFTDKELKGFELQNVIGVSCRLSVGHTSGGNAKVTKVRAPKEKVTTDAPTWNFSFDGYEGTPLPEEMPNWLQEEVQTAKEYAKFRSDGTDFMAGPPAGMEAPGAEAADDSEDVPF